MKLNDKHGNRLLIGDDGIFLKLSGHPGHKHILSFNGGRVIKYVNKRNVFVPAKGKPMVGFNYYSIRLLKERFSKVKFIYIRVDKKYKKVAVDELLKKGMFLHFLKSGFEKQIFYNLGDMIDA